MNPFIDKYPCCYCDCLTPADELIELACDVFTCTDCEEI